VGDALERHVDAETATRYRASRVVPEAEELHRLLVDAGFHGVQMCPHVMTIRLPPVEAFVLCHLAATPVAGTVAALREEQRATLAAQVGRALQPYAAGEGVEVPDEANIAMAHT